MNRIVPVAKAIIALSFMFICSCAALMPDTYTNHHIKPGTKSVANNLTVRYSVQNDKKTSLLFFENHCDYQVLRSQYGNSVTIIWCCCDYNGSANRYVSIAFEPNIYTGWKITNVYEADGVCSK